MPPRMAAEFLVMFIIIDPLGALPTSLGVTKHMDSKARMETLRCRSAFGLSLLAAFSRTGKVARGR